MARLLAMLASLTIITSASAQTIQSLPPSSLPLGGAEQFVLVQGGITKRVAFSDFASSLSVGSFVLSSDLARTLSNPLVVGLYGTPISNTTPTLGQALCFTGSQWSPGNCGGSGLSPGGSTGALQYNNNGIFGGYTIGSSFTTTAGVFDLGNGLVTGAKFATGASAFNIGLLGGDLFGMLPSPSLAPGAASRNVGNLGGGLTGTLPNPGLNTAAMITALGPPRGDVSGSSYTNMVVSGIQGTPVDSTPPTPQTALVFNGSLYTPMLFSPGISQLQGQILAGPGSGLQNASIASNTITNQQLVNAPAVSIKCNYTSSIAQERDCPVSGGLAFVSGALQLSPSLGVSTQQTISDGTNKFCMLITNGTVTTLTSGACTTGTINLTADDGSTQLTADDGSTLLTADGTNPTTPCNNLKLAFNVACNATAFSLFRAL